MATLDDDIFKQAMASFQSGRLNDAEQLFKKILQQQPKHIGALNILSVVLTLLEKYSEAERYVQSALKISSSSDATFYNYGLILKALKRPTEALERFSQALSINAAVAETWNNRGTIFNDLKRYDDAVADFNKAISLQPHYSEAFCNLGKSLTELKRYDEAFAAYDKALTLKPDLAEAWLGRGNVSNELKRYDDALGAYDKALTLKPDLAEAWLGRGNVFFDLKRYDEALAAYDKALALNPDIAEVWLGRGNIFYDLKRYDEAFAAYDKALALKPDLADAWLGRGNVFFDLKRYDEAFAAYDKTLTLKPDHAGAWLGRGNIFYDLKRYDEALGAYDKALSLKLDLAEAWLGRGNVCNDLKRYDEASAAYDKALALKPDLENAWHGRGNVFNELKRYEEAFAAYDKAFTLKPDLTCAEGSRLHAKMNLCDWSNFGAESMHLISSVKNGNLNTVPFGLLAITSSSDDQFNCAKLWVANKYPQSGKPIWQGELYKNDRIRVAYISADLYLHATSHLMAGMFECHDKSRFDVIAISHGPDDNSEIRQRLKASFERFIDAKTQSDNQIANLVRELEIDILIDLKGFTTNSRTGIFARRPAPIQVNYLGYPGTMGAQYIDYIIADRVVIPENQYEFYAEKAVILPNSYQVNDAKRSIADKVFTRVEIGLPQTGFVFCCFNNCYKVTPHIFDCWMRILKQVDGSVLWLLEDNATAASNLRKEAKARGVNSDRLIFAKRMAAPDHLARHRLADLFLDTLPCNAHTTASDALWAGLPLLTLLGETFAGRVAASLLTAIHLPELITTTVEAYEKMAVDLATHPEKLAAIKGKLTKNRLTTPLFDTKIFTKHIEAAYTAIYERHQAGLAPDQIVILN